MRLSETTVQIKHGEHSVDVPLGLRYNFVQIRRLMYPGVEVAPFKLHNLINTEFVREVIGYAVNEGQEFEGSIDAEYVNAMPDQPRIYWKINNPRALQLELSWPCFENEPRPNNQGPDTPA